MQKIAMRGIASRIPYLSPSRPALGRSPPSRNRIGKPLSEQAAIDDLIGELATYLDADAIANIREACQFGIAAHAGQVRESGEAYIHHPLEVARILGQMRADGRTIIAAILHDVVEDTAITLAQLMARFGDDVGMLVDGVSKVDELEQESKAHAEAASFRKMFTAMSTDYRVIFIKLSDRLHNMRTLGSLREEKKHRVARQTLEIYAPIADRLGMRELALELADLSLFNLDPKRYRAIAKTLSANSRRRQSTLDELCVHLKHALSKAGLEARVHGREKEIYSIHRKMRQQHLALKDLQDINAIRVVTENRLQCYQALGIIHQLYKPRPSKFKDYIAIPKANGYQSLHTVVIDSIGRPVEVQIRSDMMDKVAKNGLASHIMYEMAATGEHAPEKLMRTAIDNILESARKSQDFEEYFENLKAELSPDAAYVFTPKGDIKRLPWGATVLDFAYAVHTDIGQRCVSARIGQHIAAVHQVLKGGETIEIITSRTRQPQKKWLKYAVTSKARSSIRHFLNQQNDKEAFTLGRKLLKQALHAQGYRRMRIPSAHKLALLKHLRVDDWRPLVRDIGYGKRVPGLVAKQLIAENRSATEAVPTPPAAMIIEGTERLMVTFAHCCHPIPGDKITGIMLSGRGLTVHRAQCVNRKEITPHMENYHDLAWAENAKGKFQVMLQADLHNRPGAIASISSVIAQHNSNIYNIQLGEPHHDIISVRLAIEVIHRPHLAAIMRQLRHEDSVIKLARP